MDDERCDHRRAIGTRWTCNPDTLGGQAGNAEARLDGSSLSAISALPGRARALVRSKGGRPAHYSATTVAVPDLTSRRMRNGSSVSPRDRRAPENADGDRDVYCLNWRSSR